jgi:predicted DCC family thiol-disulfide oxidoreductase YuxK
MKVLGEAIVFFDSECLLCDRAVQWLVRLDAAGRLQFAPLGGETFARLKSEGVDTARFAGKRTMVLARRKHGGEWRLFSQSDAVIGAMEVARGAPRRLAVLRTLPRPVRDLGYRTVAAVRYHVFGKVAACSLAKGAEQARLLP